jgi:hypothetical protein
VFGIVDVHHEMFSLMDVKIGMVLPEIPLYAIQCAFFGCVVIDY